ncbi:META domain-containing protein [uncultured Rikenella sp.]|uniref:META domain-containing protein n=1 Tax=uncultured Rikenella sp. TaxID=368003 RepID=UPI00260985E1|nr:META domain-containing protein [uncultured Rikenella sp.]
MKKTFTLAALALTAVVMGSCCACRKGSPKIANLETDDWKLIEFRGEAVPSDKAVTLTFDPEKKMIYGQAPCNNFFAGYSLFKDAEHNIEIANAGATRKFCPDTEIEDGFTRELTNIKRLKIEGGRLLMLNAEGDLVALLTAVPRTAETE